FFFLLPPPISTLFPYTTLFRSVFLFHLVGNNVHLKPPPVRCLDLLFHNLPCLDHLVHVLNDGGVPDVVQQVCKRFPQIARLKIKDRKSTRLNSSHVKISYAVFC